MRAYIFIPLLLVSFCTHAPLKSTDYKTIEGIALRSKAGLVVCGVMVTSLTDEEMNLYQGKIIRLKGYIAEEHGWQVNENDTIKKQGFNMPVMYRVLSIEIIRERKE